MEMTPAKVHVRLLGAFELTVDTGVVVTRLPTRRASELVQLLALARPIDGSHAIRSSTRCGRRSTRRRAEPTCARRLTMPATLSRTRKQSSCSNYTWSCFLVSR